MKMLGVVILSVVFTVLGLAGGFLAAKQTTSSGGGHDHGGHESHAGHDHGAHEGHDHGPEKPKISPQAAKNLGITLADVETTSFVKFQSVPAKVVEMPGSRQPLVAPLGGIVSEIKVVPGSTAAAGAVVVTIIREALPRPVLTLTEEIIKPVSEQIHTSMGELRRASRGIEILQTELNRIKQFTQGAGEGLALLPKKNEIDIRYELARAEQELQNVREKLRLHGFSDEQITALEKGGAAPPVNQQVWKRALQRNGLWPESADAIMAALPADTQAAPWHVAAIGELAGAGLATGELAAWLKSDTAAALNFLEIAGLLQRGHSLAQVQSLTKLNALSPIIQVQVPAGAADWDVLEVLVTPNEKVEAGQKLATLVNLRQMQLRTEPVGGETAVILNALKQRADIEAAPLLDGVAPRLSGLKFSHVASDDQSSGTVAFARVDNKALETVDEGARGKFRTWQIRPGQRYMLRIPTEALKDVFVLPSGAVTDEGPDKVVFIQDGESYTSKKVAVLHQDHEVVVLDGKTSELFPGDSVVQRGAFGLSLALRSSPAAAEHGHDHD
jgi:membrane fusion protein, heavy metal efflux system